MARANGIAGERAPRLIRTSRIRELIRSGPWPVEPSTGRRQTAERRGSGCIRVTRFDTVILGSPIGSAEQTDHGCRGNPNEPTYTHYRDRERTVLDGAVARLAVDGKDRERLLGREEGLNFGVR